MTLTDEPASRRRWVVALAAIVLAAILTLFCADDAIVLRQVIQFIREDARQRQVRNNLEQFKRALDNYHQTYPVSGPEKLEASERRPPLPGSPGK